MGYNTDILDDNNVSAYGKLVYFTLSKYADKDGVCWPSFKTIAEKAGVSTRTAKRVIDELINAGWVRRDKRKSTRGDFDNNLYLLTTPRVVSVSHNVVTNRHNLVTDSPGVVSDIPNGSVTQSQRVVSDRHTNLSNITNPINLSSELNQTTKNVNKNKNILLSSTEDDSDCWDIINEYHTVCHELPPVETLSKKRKKLIRDGLKKFGRDEISKGFQDVAKTARAKELATEFSPTRVFDYLMGRHGFLFNEYW